MSEKDPKPTWIIPAIAVPLPDGSTLIKPGKAVQRCTTARAVRLTGIPRQTIHALADAGLIRRERPSPGQSFVYPGEIEQLLRDSAADPNYWNAVRTKAFLTGSDLKSATPK